MAIATVREKSSERHSIGSSVCMLQANVRRGISDPLSTQRRLSKPNEHRTKVLSKSKIYNRSTKVFGTSPSQGVIGGCNNSAAWGVAAATDNVLLRDLPELLLDDWTKVGAVLLRVGSVSIWMAAGSCCHRLFIR